MGMVHWLAPRFLIRASHEVDESGRFARFTDKRELEAGLPTALYDPRDVERSDVTLPPYDDASYRDEHGDLWIDFASDVGEGFSPTYTVAWLLSRPTLKLSDGERTYETKRGRLLVLGGDQVYPSASWVRYRDRFVGPYTAALPWVEEEGKAPHLFAIPGNHDWYDGLTNFMRVFCAGAWIGGWRTRQRRSYFAFRLSEQWWLWATDIQFDTYLDSPQLDYFRAAARSLRQDDRVILVTAKPSWVGAGARKGELMTTGSWETLSYVEENLVASRGAKVAVTLTGDKHHYSRYAATAGDLPEQRITAGGGGAHTSATHGLPTTADLPVHGSERVARYARQEVVSPTAEESKQMRDRIVYRVLSVGTLGLLIAGIYLLIAGLFEVNWIPGTAVSAALGVGLFAFAKAKQPAGFARAAALSVVHAAAHTGVILLMIAAHLPLPLIAVLGYPVGLTIFGLYLLLANRMDAKQHATEIFGGLASTEYKNFLRLQLKRDGSLTIYPVGIKSPPEWRVRPEGAPGTPWFAAKGCDEEDPAAKLLEPPIGVSKPPPARFG
jgi:hypothetical protein